MYEDQDSSTLQGQIREVIENRTQQQQESDSKSKRKMTRTEMN